MLQKKQLEMNMEHIHSLNEKMFFLVYKCFEQTIL